ncbi:hypothetical protein K3495_g3590 [Podosphaera aphanis]|nr:hypothetical protein K3495_g3590 [Podosphaera aphanis]
MEVIWAEHLEAEHVNGPETQETRKQSHNTSIEEKNTTTIVIKSTEPPSSSPLGYAFVGRRYAEIKLTLASPNNPVIHGGLGTGCTMSLIDKCALKKYSPTTPVLTMDKPMKVKGFGDKQYDASTFVVLDIFMPGSNNTTPHIRREFHIMENLDAKILLGIDIASPEGWLIDLKNEELVMPHCQGISVPISTKVRAPISTTRVFATSKTRVPSHSRKLIKVGNKDGSKINLPVHDKLYEPKA